jgi:GT2 family glycosyltransferase
MKKIFTIIVTYNGMKWYRKCFDSLRNSSIPLQIIVIDNASTDNTVAFIKESYPEIRLIESKENLGFGKANNIGFKYALENDADYVFLLNQDAWVYPDTIEQLCKQMEQNPEYGVLSPIHLNGTEKSLDNNFANYINNEKCSNLISDYIVKSKPEDRIYQIEFVNAALWLISKDCLNKIGGFCPLFAHYGEDSNYADRLRYHNIKIGIYPYAWAVHDRNQKKEMSKLQQAKWTYISSLVRLSNINKSFIYCFLWYVNRIVGSLLKGKLYNMESYFSLLFLIPQIIKHRKITKK